MKSINRWVVRALCRHLRVALLLQRRRSPNGYLSNSNYNYAWVVQSGDVGAVPVPAAVWLFGSGLIGMIGLMRKKRGQKDFTPC